MQRHNFILYFNLACAECQSSDFLIKRWEGNSKGKLFLENYFSVGSVIQTELLCTHMITGSFEKQKGSTLPGSQEECAQGEIAEKDFQLALEFRMIVTA